jgi:ankyrin repeat protein
MKTSIITLLLVALTTLAPASQTLADTILTSAIRADDMATVKTLLDQGARTDTRSNRFTPLALAAIRGNADMVALLLKAGADPDLASLSGANALSTAVRSCRAGLDIVRMLVAAGADLENRSGDGITPVMLAVQEQRTDIALYLLDAGADVNTLNPFGEGLLNYAIYVKNPVLIQSVLDRGIETTQLRKLFTTIDYDPPGIGDTPSHHQVLCSQVF